MKIAYLVLAHQLNDQLRLLLETLASDGRSRIYVHMDSKCRDLGWLADVDPDVLTLIPRRHAVNWAGYTMVDAMTELLQAATGEPNNAKFVLLTATCFPLRPMSDVNDHILNLPGSLMAIWGSIDPSDPALEGTGGGTVNKYFFNDVALWNPSKGKMYHRLWSVYKKVNALLPYRRRLQYGQIWRGSVYFVMDRALATSCCALPPALVHDLKYALGPDEMAFATLYAEQAARTGGTVPLTSPDATLQALHYIRMRVPQRSEMSLRSRLFDMVDLRRLDESDIADADASGALFTRKCSLLVSQVLSRRQNLSRPRIVARA